MLKASNWLTHLEYDWESPVWRHWIRFLAENFRIVRFDERGCGMTDWDVGWFNELCRTTTSPEAAARLLEVRGQIDVTHLLSRVRTPTLVLHARKDRVSSLDEGRRLAAGIPGAQFVELDSRNHILLEDEPAWGRFREALLDFVGIAAPHGEDSAFASLSCREREILVLVTEGLGNAAIAERLALSEKTVRNHVSNMLDQLGVWTGAQAIVFARDRGFRA